MGDFGWLVGCWLVFNMEPSYSLFLEAMRTAFWIWFWAGTGRREEGRQAGRRKGRGGTGLWQHRATLSRFQDLLQNSPNSMSGVSSNPQGIVVPASALQQSNIAMTTVNSQVVSGWCRGLWGRPGKRNGRGAARWVPYLKGSVSYSVVSAKTWL